MIRVRRRRALVFFAAVFVTVWLVPSRGAAAGTRHHDRRTHECQATCLAQSQRNVVDSQHPTRLTHGDDVADDFDDRDDRTAPTSTPIVLDEGSSKPEPALACPWARTGRAADPRAARLIVWRKLTPRPPPSQ
jgi:hypothetical protein